MGNYAQIARKVPQVTNTQQAVDHAGRGSEMAYQEMLKGLELKRDMETSLIGSTGTSTGGGKQSGSDTVVRRLGPLLSWVKSNTSVSTSGTTGVEPTGDGSNIRTDGTQRAFTEAQLKTVLSSAWNNGGEPGTIMTGAFNKQVFSTFTGRASPIEQASSKKITASVDAYESDFGRLKVVPNRFQRARDVWVLQMDMWAAAYLRPITSIMLAINGDSQRKEIVTEYTMEARNEKASGGVFDLTTS